MISPSHDRFVGVTNLELRSDGEWLKELTVDLYPWDAGPEQGSEFDDDNDEEYERIASLRNTVKFADEPVRL